jgi:hypothetical protein
VCFALYCSQEKNFPQSNFLRRGAPGGSCSVVLISARAPIKSVKSMLSRHIFFRIKIRGLKRTQTDEIFKNFNMKIGLTLKYYGL